MTAPHLQLKYFVPAMVWMAIIFYVSSIPGDQIPEVRLWSADKIAHLLVFSALSLSSWRAVRHYAEVHGRSLRWVVGVSALGCILYGASDEIHQYFVPNRSSEWADLAADTVGILITHGVLWRLSISRMKVEADVRTR